MIYIDIDLLAHSEILAGRLGVDSLSEEVRLAGYPSRPARKSMANSTELLGAHHQDRLHESYLGFKKHIQNKLASALQDMATNMMKHVSNMLRDVVDCKKNPMSFEKRRETWAPKATIHYSAKHCAWPVQTGIL